MAKGFESARTIARRALPKKPRRIPVKFCRCGHPKSSHERHPAVVDLGVPSGDNCLMCDCAEYRFGSKRVA